MARPSWLGQRTLPTSSNGLVVVPQTTPEELRDRRLLTIDTLPTPADESFRFTIGAIPADVLARSTWVDGCPVPVDGLAYLTMTFWGFDGRVHTGEMIVNAAQADNMVSVFEKLHAARFPIEEMRVVSQADLDAEPTGDGNNTTAFVCRAVTGGSRFSEHAYGLAIDINPFHNPYKRGALILPELAVEYLDRAGQKPGVVVAGDVAVEAFAAIGWEWGGDWRSLKDYQHFALNNR
ncbi:MAG: M15 family metallopeptidase [Acidimicrobiales bacterium]